MRFTLKKYIKKPSLFIYPVIIIVTIPVLLVINTFWNLQNFNRDINYVIRHQAVSITQTLEPFIIRALSNKEDISFVLNSAKKANSEIVSIVLLKKEGEKFAVLGKTDKNAEKEAEDPLNQMAVTMKEPFAALTFDSGLSQNVWNVVSPLHIDKTNSYVLRLTMKRDIVDTLLNRTSKDSYLILAILILVTLLLLSNHFIFYKKAVRAQQLDEIDKLKDEFISLASHELRTPVTALKGFIDMLQKKLPAEAASLVDHELQALRTLTKGLQDLINDLLEVSRIEQGRLELHYAETDVNKTIADVIQNLTPLAAEKQLAINFTPVELPKIKSDPSRLSQVLVNLINNSIKYTLKGKIDISAVEKADQISITIQDTGIGIPAEKIPTLFGKFNRIRDEKTQNVQGTGLGLWITKQIVELLGGKIFAESMYGTGTIFTFSLPVRKMA